MLTTIEDREHLHKVQEKHKDFMVLAFWGNFSEAARRGLSEIEKFSREQKDVPVYMVDVEKARGLHKEFGVKKVPTVLSLEKGRKTKFIEGVQSAAFYAVHLSGAAAKQRPAGGKAPPRRVVVYSGPGCPPCGMLKNYLRRNGISYREVDISRHQRAAGKISRRSGSMAVPQTDINGQIVVGFDQPKLSRLLGIQSERGGNED